MAFSGKESAKGLGPEHFISEVSVSVSGLNAAKPIPVYPPLPSKVPDDLEHGGGHSDQARFDMIIIGGGINGAGIARDAAERGLKVLLVDKGDFGAETTAHSTRLIHGGLRYLENVKNAWKNPRDLGDLYLVYESLHERERLLKNAPHLVRPLQLGIPIYGNSAQSKTKQRPKWYVKAGMLGYDVLSAGKSLPMHKMLDRDAFIKQFPGIETNNLKGGAVYYDAQVTLSERLTLENVLAAHETGNADIRSHTKVDEIIASNRQAKGVVFTDLLTNERFVDQGKVIVNAGGPWVDEIARLAVKVDGTQSTAPKRRIGGVEGTHIVVKKWPGAPEHALYVEAESNGRPYFIVPFLKDKMLIGTTEEFYNDDPDRVHATEKEITYLLKETNRVLPGASLTRDKILYTYSGIRPLPYVEPPSGRKFPGKSTANKITRRHIIEDHKDDSDLPLSGFISIIGGKITTYRNLARQTVDKAIANYKLALRDDLDYFGHDFPVGDSTTAKTPLPGGSGINGDLTAYKIHEIPKAAQQYAVPKDTVDHLIDLYGSRYSRVLDLGIPDPDLYTPLIPGSPNIRAQVVYAVQSELARTVEDVLHRMGAHLNDHVGLDEADAVANVLKSRCGFSDIALQQQLADYRKQVSEKNLLQ